MSALRSTSHKMHEAVSVSEPEEDVGLVARAKSDRQAFALLYRSHVDAVYRYCAHRLGDRHAAEDATSEIFLKAFAGIQSCRDDRAFRSWLFSISHNVVADHYRAKRPEAAIESAHEVFDSSPNPEESAIAADADRIVHALLARLVPRQARILELRLAGLKGPEIAEVLGCSLASVKIGQVRAYGRLREIVGDSAPEGDDDDR